MQLKGHAFDCEFYLISVCSDFDFWAVHILKIRKNKFCAKMYMFTLDLYIMANRIRNLLLRLTPQLPIAML